MSALAPFNPEATCPKCGHDDIRSSFHRNVHDCGFREPYIREEHLERLCRRCSFSWMEAPLDATLRGETD